MILYGDHKNAIQAIYDSLNQKEGKVLKHISIIIKLIRAITAMLAQIKDLIS